jgi:DNA-directed RNA polymerase subunit delta
VAQERNKQAQQILSHCYQLLKSTREPMHFRDLLKLGWDQTQPETELSSTILTNLYTNLNLDPRFVSLGRGQWGLSEWRLRPSRSNIPVASLLGKSYQYDRDDSDQKPDPPAMMALEDDEDALLMEERLLSLEDDGEQDPDEPWPENEDEEDDEFFP